MRMIKAARVAATAAAIAFLAAGAFSAGTGVHAQPAEHHGADHHDHMEQGDHHAPRAEAVDTPAIRAFEDINARMHEEMAIDYTGDADIDFARAMIPHHQGAIDMARVVLEYGTDPEIRHLAEEIIAAQESEIAFLEEWLQRRTP
jgi:uncharacterized protein (DUF305 family)